MLDYGLEELMKTRTPALNAKNNRRARAIKLIEGKLALKDSELTQRAPAKEIKSYRAELTSHLVKLKQIQNAKGGTL